jgi:cytochrome oxidase Cu insertion factor (SCO1/SenC/PrrC family)
MADRQALGRAPPKHALLIGAAALLGAAIGISAALLRTSHTSAASDTPAAEGQRSLRGQVNWGAGRKLAPKVVLRDENGTMVSLHSLRGHVVLLTFLDSRCKRECPVEGRTLAAVQRQVAGTSAELVVISVNPWADTAASVRTFAARSRWRGDWHWLLGRRTSLAPVWRAYNIVVKRTPDDILHATALYLIDPRGYLRAGYLFPFAADVVAGDVRRLAAST